MGLDLRLLPFDSHPSTEIHYSHTILSVERTGVGHDIYDALHEKEMRVPKRFLTFCSRGPEYEDSHYGDTEETPYGEPLGYVLVRDLLKYAKRKYVTENRTNRAIWAYLGALDPATPVALYWH